VNRLTFGGCIIETGTDSYRLARTCPTDPEETPLESAPAGQGACAQCYYLRMRAISKGVESLPVDQAELVVEVFRMLSDTTRVRLLWALLDRELAVNQLVELVGKSAPSVSQHLAKLRMARLVRTRREGTQVFYRLETEHVARLVRDAVFNAEHSGPDLPRHHQDGSHPNGQGEAPLSVVPRSRPAGRGVR